MQCHFDSLVALKNTVWLLFWGIAAPERSDACFTTWSDSSHGSYPCCRACRRA